MSGIEKKDLNLADLQKEYLAFPNPYKDAPSSKFDYHALAEYAKKKGKSINELSFEEKAQFVI